MTRRFFAALLFALWSWSAIAGWSAATDVGHSATGGPTTTLTVGATIPAGSLVYVTGWDDNLGGLLTGAAGSVTDSVGNTWNPIAHKALNAALANGIGETFYSVLTTGLTSGVGTITYSPAGGDAADNIYMEATYWTGNASGTPLDLNVSATGNSTTPSSGSSGTPTQSGEQFVGSVVFKANGTTFTQPSGFGHAPNDFTTFNPELSSGALVEAATSAHTYNPTGPGASQPWAAFIASFKVAATTATPQLSLIGVGP